MPEGLIGRMETAMEGWQEAVEQDAAEKVVPFPLAEEESEIPETVVVAEGCGPPLPAWLSSGEWRP